MASNGLVDVAPMQRELRGHRPEGPDERRGRDSNPRYACTHNGFRDRPVQPLRHLSVGAYCAGTKEGTEYRVRVSVGRDPARTTPEDDCADGVCSTDAPAVVAGVLTGCGLTVSQAAEALARGEDVALTDLQRRIVERHALEHGWT